MAHCPPPRQPGLRLSPTRGGVRDATGGSQKVVDQGQRSGLFWVSGAEPADPGHPHPDPGDSHREAGSAGGLSVGRLEPGREAARPLAGHRDLLIML